jgi:hypothetical protein
MEKGLYQKVDEDLKNAILNATERVNQVPQYKQDFAYKLVKLRDIDASLWDLNSTVIEIYGYAGLSRQIK